MLVRAVLAMAVLTVSAHASDFDRTLRVADPADVYLSTNSGRIHIFPGSDAEVHIRAHLHASGTADGDVDERMRRIAADPPIQQSGNVIHVGEVSAQQRSLFNDITIDYEVTVPRSAALNLRSGSGDIEVDNVGRFLKAETGSGSVRAHGIAGACDLHSGSGDIELQQTAQGEVKARSGSGSIRVNGLVGGIHAQTGSGDLEVGGHLLAASRLQTGSGSIRVHTGGNAHFNLNASSGSGSIRVPGSWNSDAHHISMPIQGGGVALDAQTGSGDIEIN